MEHLIVNEIVLPKLKKLDDKIWQLSDETDAKIEGLKQGTYELADSILKTVKQDTDTLAQTVDKLIKDNVISTDKARVSVSCFTVFSILSANSYVPCFRPSILASVSSDNCHILSSNFFSFGSTISFTIRCSIFILYYIVI